MPSFSCLLDIIPVTDVKIIITDAQKINPSLMLSGLF